MNSFAYSAGRAIYTLVKTLVRIATSRWTGVVLVFVLTLVIILQNIPGVPLQRRFVQAAPQATPTVLVETTVPTGIPTAPAVLPTPTATVAKEEEVATVLPTSTVASILVATPIRQPTPTPKPAPTAAPVVQPTPAPEPPKPQVTWFPIGAGQVIKVNRGGCISGDVQMAWGPDQAFTAYHDDDGSTAAFVCVSGDVEAGWAKAPFGASGVYGLDWEALGDAIASGGKFTRVTGLLFPGTVPIYEK